MAKTCKICGKKTRKYGNLCWIHKRDLDRRKEKKKQIEENLRYYGKIMRTGYMIQLGKFRDDICRNFEKEKKKFREREEKHKETMKIWEELFDEEYQVIPNKFKEIMQKKKD